MEEQRSPSTWVVEQAMRLPAGSVIVDIAGGTGRHAIPLARAGYDVVLVDFIEDALRAACAREPRLHAVVADAWSLPFASASVDAVIVVNFLERELVRPFISLLRTGGVIIWETYTQENIALVDSGTVRAPRSPAYLLEPSELAFLVSPLTVVAQREGRVDDAAGPRFVGSIVARRTD